MLPDCKVIHFYPSNVQNQLVE